MTHRYVQGNPGRGRLACPGCGLRVLRPLPAGGLECGLCGIEYPVVEGVQFFVDPRALGPVESLQRQLYDQRNPDLHQVLLGEPGTGRGVIEPNRLGTLPDITLTYRRHCREIAKLGIRPGDAVLDIGCATGMLLTQICRSNECDGVGVDISPKSVAVAQAVNLLKLDYYVAEAEALPFADQEFDYVLCFDVLEHTARPKKAIREAYRCLKPGGVALYHVPVSDTLLSIDWWMARLGTESWEKRMAAVGHDYGRMLSGRALLEEFERAGFEVRRARRFNVFLQNLFDYHLTTVHRILGLLFQRGVRLGGRRRPLSFALYHRGIAPVVELLTLPDRLLAWAGIGASVYAVLRRPER